MKCETRMVEQLERFKRQLKYGSVTTETTSLVKKLDEQAVELRSSMETKYFELRVEITLLKTQLKRVD